jgi:amino acid transporter
VEPGLFHRPFGDFPRAFRFLLVLFHPLHRTSRRLPAPDARTASAMAHCCSPHRFRLVPDLRGARDVGLSAKFSIAIVCGAFAALVLIWITAHLNPVATFHLLTNDLRTDHRDALLLGISLIVLNYSGWDNASTYANEVEQPQRNYPRAIGLALLIVVAGYVLPVLAGLSVTTDPALWSSDAGWPVIAKLIGGPWLGAVLAIAGLVSTWAMFNAQLLYVSRLPLVMAHDRWLPDIFARVSPVTGSPQISIICISLLTALFAALSFGGLAVIQAFSTQPPLLLNFLRSSFYVFVVLMLTAASASPAAGGA